MCLVVLEVRAGLQGTEFRSGDIWKVNWRLFIYVILTEMNIHTCRREISLLLVERQVSLPVWRRRGNSVSPHLNMWEYLCWFRSKAHLAQLPSTVAVSRCLVSFQKKTMCFITPLSIPWLFLVQRISWALNFGISNWYPIMNLFSTYLSSFSLSLCRHL